MSGLGAALRATRLNSKEQTGGSFSDASGSNSSSNSSSTNNATTPAPAAFDATLLPQKLHFFPLPSPPVWRVATINGISGCDLPRLAGHTMVLMNHGRALLLFGGLGGQDRAIGSPAGATPFRSEYFIIDCAPPKVPPVVPPTSIPPIRVMALGPPVGVEVSHVQRCAHACVALSQHTAYVSGGWNGSKYVSSGVVIDLASKTLLFEQNNAASLPNAATTPTMAAAQSLLSTPTPNSTATSPIFTATSLAAHLKTPRILPSPRRDHSMLRINSKVLLLMGGWNGEECILDPWVCKLVKIPRAQLPPSYFQQHLSNSSNGGESNPQQSTTARPKHWVWSPLRLSSSSAFPPAPRRGANLVKISRSHVLLFGGLRGYATYSNEVSLLDVQNRLWMPAVSYSGSPPSPRAWAAMHAYPRRPSLVLLFGGVGSKGFCNDLFLLDTKGKRWYPLMQNGVSMDPATKQPFLPTPRCSMASAMVGTQLWIHGGFTYAAVPLADVLEDDHSNNSSNRNSTKEKKIVVPSQDLWILDTKLPALAHGEEEEAAVDDSDSSDEEEDSSDEEEGATNQNDDALSTLVSTSHHGPTSSFSSAPAALMTHGGHTSSIISTPKSNTSSHSRGASGSKAGLGSTSPTNQDDNSNAFNPRDVYTRTRSLSNAHPPPMMAQALFHEGWLALLQNGTLAAAASGALSPRSGNSITNRTGGAGAATGSSNAYDWSRRFVKLERHQLLAYQMEDIAASNGGLVPLAQGVLKPWVDVHQLAIQSMLDAAANAENSNGMDDASLENWLATAASSASISLAAGQDLWAVANATPSVTSQMILERVLQPTDSSHASFLRYVSSTSSSGGWKEVVSAVVDMRLWKRCNTSNATVGGDRERALVLTRLYFTPGGRVENIGGISNITDIRNTLTASVAASSSGSGSGPISPNLFDKVDLLLTAHIGDNIIPAWLASLSLHSNTVASVAQHQSGDEDPFYLKSTLSDADRDVASCGLCLLRFTSKQTKHRSFCSYCHLVVCDKCALSQITLPPEIQRLFDQKQQQKLQQQQQGGGSNMKARISNPALPGSAVAPSIARIRVCDMCAHIFASSSTGVGNASSVSSTSSSTSSSSRLNVFSFASNRTPGTKLHLASDSLPYLRGWMNLIDDAIRASSSLPAGMDSNSNNSSPEKAARGIGGKVSPHTVEPVQSSLYKEGWLMREEPLGSKVFKKQFVILCKSDAAAEEGITSASATSSAASNANPSSFASPSSLSTAGGIGLDLDSSISLGSGASVGYVLRFYEPILRKSYKLVSTTVIKAEKEIVNIAASGWGSNSSSLQWREPNKWPTVYPLQVSTDTEPTSPTSPGRGSSATTYSSGGSSSLVIACSDAKDRDEWLDFIQRDIQLLSAHGSSQGASLSPRSPTEEDGSSSSSSSRAHRSSTAGSVGRYRSASVPSTPPNAPSALRGATREENNFPQTVVEED